jgi:ubiquitin C-terminal hydrolase
MEIVEKADGRIGLVNLGNTCFLNSALQLLRHNKTLYKYFQSGDWKHRITTENKYTPMVAPISEFVLSIWRDDLLRGTKISPGKFYQTLVGIADKVGYDDLAEKHRQADAGEALLFLIDCLHEGLAHPVEMAITGEAVSKTEQRLYKSYECWIQNYKKQWSSVVKVLHGQKLSVNICKKCGHITDAYESWSSLSIPILNATEPGMPAPSLYDCLKEYFKVETLEDYKCDGCKTKGDIDRSIRLSIIPEYIIVILNRFTNSGAKVKAKIDFDLDNVKLNEWFIGNQDTSTTYRAVAVIDHRGSLAGGHYVSSARWEKDPSIWYRYDDDSVNEISATAVNNGDTYVILLESTKIESKTRG